MRIVPELAGFGPLEFSLSPVLVGETPVCSLYLCSDNSVSRRLSSVQLQCKVYQTILGGIISTSTITYSVNGRQYVAVLTGDAQSGTAGLLGVVKDIKPVRGHNAIYVFALPAKI